MQINYKNKTFLYSLVSLTSGVLVCYAFLYFFPSYLLGIPSSTKSFRLKQKDYPLINPILLCNLDAPTASRNKKIESDIRDFIDSRISAGLAENMSVYLVDYTSGKWAGVNENDKYDPASMLKVPVMIGYYRQAEENPKILSEQTSYTGDDQNTSEYFKSKNNIKSGKMYAISELIKSMVVNSDNTALILLQNYIGERNLIDVYTDLGLPVPLVAPNVEYLSAKLYAYFFRVLYNGTYLDHKYSEQALELLTSPDIEGIRSGVPADITVAQKFGERSVYDVKGKLVDRELHDCGIIYKPNSPYLLCIMSRGQDFDKLLKNIVDLSSLVYEEVGNK